MGTLANNLIHSMETTCGLLAFITHSGISVSLYAVCLFSHVCGQFHTVISVVITRINYGKWVPLESKLGMFVWHNKDQESADGEISVYLCNLTESLFVCIRMSVRFLDHRSSNRLHARRPCPLSTRGSVLSSVKLFGWAAYEMAANSNCGEKQPNP